MKLPVWRHHAVEHLKFIEPPVVLLNRANESHTGGGHAKPRGFGELPLSVDISFLAIEEPSQEFVQFIHTQGQATSACAVRSRSPRFQRSAYCPDVVG